MKTSTGKNDINGKKIYIGDKLQNKHGVNYEVKEIDNTIVLVDGGNHKLYKKFLFLKIYTGLKRFITINGGLAIYHEKSNTILQVIGGMPDMIKSLQLKKIVTNTNEYK